MAETVYGNWIGEQASGKITQRAFLTYNIVEDNATSQIIQVMAGIQQWNGTWTNIGTSCTLTNYGTVTDTITHSGANAMHNAFSSKQFTLTKSGKAQTLTITATSMVTSGVDTAHGKDAVLNKPSTASQTFTIPACLKVNVSGTWRTGYVYVNVGGTWKDAAEIKTNVNGTWKDTTL